MSRTGISKEKIVDMAIYMVEENGIDELSLRGLAAQLNIKAASLYNHVEGISEIKTAVGLKAIGMLGGELEKASRGYERDDAIRAIAEAYRTFAKEHAQMYRMIIEVPESGDDILCQEWTRSIRPISNVIKQYKISDENVINLMRFFRSTMHGFVALEKHGFLKDDSVDIENSFDEIITFIIGSIHSCEQ